MLRVSVPRNSNWSRIWLRYDNQKKKIDVITKLKLPFRHHQPARGSFKQISTGDYKLEKIFFFCPPGTFVGIVQLSFSQCIWLITFDSWKNRNCEYFERTNSPTLLTDQENKKLHLETRPVIKGNCSKLSGFNFTCSLDTGIIFCLCP